MPYRKDNKQSQSNSKNQLEASEDLEDTPVYITAPRYAPIKHKINQPTYYFEPHLINANEITPGITRSEYETRRKLLFSKIPLDSCLILPSNPESKFSSDGKYSYRQNAELNYFTGLQEAYCLAVFTKDAAGNCSYLLFVQKIIERERCWYGHRCGLSAAIKYFGAHESYPYMGNKHKICDIMEAHDRVYFDELVNDDITLQIRAYVNKKNSKIRLLKPRKMMQQIRVIKSTPEIALLRKSAEISALSMIDAMQYCTPGMLENELSVQFEYGCKKRGAQRLSYECSVASGLNAVNLTYFNNNSMLMDGELVLIDCGCEYNGYSSDITRTFPVNGRFNEAQRELYEMVLSVSDQLIAAMNVGCTIKKLEQLTAKWIKKGLRELGVTAKLGNHDIKEMKLSCADVHFVSHFIGLDIHDTSGIPHGRVFEENMVLAIEPAVYIADHPLIPPKYRNIGIRIEDDVLITANGAEILSGALPRSVSDIERYMATSCMYPRTVPFSLLLPSEGRIQRVYDCEWGECDIAAARTLSTIRFEATKKEKVKRELFRKQFDAIKLLQQLLFEEEEKSTKRSSNKEETERRTRSGKRYQSQTVIKSGSQQKQKEKKESNGRIPKLSSSSSHSASSGFVYKTAKRVTPIKSVKRRAEPNKKLNKKEVMREGIVISKFDDTDSTNSIISHCTSSGVQSVDIPISKKKKSIYCSPTSSHSNGNHHRNKRKRKREDDKDKHNRYRTDKSDRNERYKKKHEPPAKKNKVDHHKHKERSNYRYKYQYNDHYSYPSYSVNPYYEDDPSSPSLSKYYADNGGIPYMSYSMPFYTYSASNSNAESAYDQFMAKSNDKNNNN